MDPVSIATAVMAVLGPYLTKAGEAVAEELGKQTLVKGEALLKTLWSRFTGKSKAEGVLAAYAADPVKGRDALFGTLVAELVQDPGFVEQLDGVLHSDQPDVYIKQFAGEDADITGAKIRELLSGHLKVVQEVRDGARAVGIEVDSFGKR